MMKPASVISTRRAAVLFIPVLAAVIIGGYLFLSHSVKKDFAGYLSRLYSIERSVIEHVPIYEDFSSPEKEASLRRYLLQSHLKVAAGSGMKPVADDEAAKALTDTGKLVPVKSDTDALYYLYNVRNQHRYITPETLRGLETLCARFQHNLGRRTKMPPVKIALSSLLRPVAYQHSLRGKNANATMESTHTYGISFDIFFDDYYVSLPEPVASTGLSRTLLEMLNRKLGFMLGDSLRRQFRSVLMECLIELQNEGVLYAILERNQRCYHVTVLKK